MQKDDIIIRKAIVHILDYQKGVLGLSDALLELSPDLNDFIRGHIYKLVASDDMKKCHFNEENSPFYSMLETFDEADEETYIGVSKKAAECFFEVMCDSGEIPSADLVVASFQIESTVHLALLKMNYKENYVHAQLGENQNDIIKERIVLPSESSRLTEAAVINLKTMEIRLIEKRYEINGEKVDYLSERVLLCHTDLPPKKKLNILTKAIQDINNKYDDRDINAKMEAKSILQQEFVENQQFDVNEIGDKIFGDHVEMKQDFDEVLEKYDMQYDTFTVTNENTVKKLEKQVLLTDTGIEIKIPMEEYNSKSNVEVLEEPGGVKTIVIKNIENLTLK
ncbi:MAG: nucleoid-associated protein [Lachnospiraceae bacterium]|nr:nucleoid-associated protein [Lachnospiraceae bacterium]